MQTLHSSGTATTASNANNIAVVDESSDTTCSVLYTNAASGYHVAAKTGTNLLFDSVQGTLKPTNVNATGIITASSFSGNADECHHCIYCRCSNKSYGNGSVF